MQCLSLLGLFTRSTGNERSTPVGSRVLLQVDDPLKISSPCVCGTGGPAARELLAASDEKMKAAEMALHIRSPVSSFYTQIIGDVARGLCALGSPDDGR
ncbi:uncharacterized protein AKAW2_10831A [Aspergillus luchuensis]|uniref:Uncharacterized protein n=1 Tax=Aspergillus kawachii TaxID=1069201 RepID=A0A7R7WNT9_ASPKA|nr:uncharacterized protein AKAW2_10831A [Aspergillus luchuensis]BCR93785.1 hypothetical protein AKAW2_10831A [Aspergillus luchuensis]BCS06407.1 hypothetical protein ALUC_10788A [Aspergillus luchuensis]